MFLLQTNWLRTNWSAVLTPLGSLADGAAGVVPPARWSVWVLGLYPPPVSASFSDLPLDRDFWNFSELR